MSSFSYNRYDNSRHRRPLPTASSYRSVLGYWTPLAITVTIATVGLAAWIWNERRDGSDADNDGSDQREELVHHDEGDSPSLRHRTPSHRRYDSQNEKEAIMMTDDLNEDKSNKEPKNTVTEQDSDGQSGGLVARMHDVIRRTPSPQQLFNAASRGVNAAADAMMGGKRIIEGGRSILDPSTGEDFAHFERKGWGEEVEKRGMMESDTTDHLTGSWTKIEKKTTKNQAMSKRNVVAIVLDSVSHDVDIEVEGENRNAHHEVGSLSKPTTEPSHYKRHEDRHIVTSADCVFAAIQSILSGLPLTINLDAIQLLILIHAPPLVVYSLNMEMPTRSDDLPSSYIDIVSTASKFVAHPTHILPFSSPTGYIHLLRHLGPSLVYIEESLCGGEHDVDRLRAIEGWVGKIVVVTTNGLVDKRKNIFGNGIDVVELDRVKEDWRSKFGV